jgi:hypothetical protein
MLNLIEQQYAAPYLDACFFFAGLGYITHTSSKVPKKVKGEVIPVLN